MASAFCKSVTSCTKRRWRFWPKGKACNIKLKLPSGPMRSINKGSSKLRLFKYCMNSGRRIKKLMRCMTSRLKMRPKNLSAIPLHHSIWSLSSSMTIPLGEAWNASIKCSCCCSILRICCFRFLTRR